MRQVLQNLRSGETEVAEVPAPQCRRGTLLIRTHRTLVSSGTERMLVEFGRSGLLGKAMQQPERVREVLDKMRTDGVAPTLEAVRSKLDQPLPLGYCNVGTVLEVGEGVENFSPGDRVISNGSHAEIVCVPQNLCARVPDGVNDDAAAFTVLGSIALQGIRLVGPTLGETVVVTGLGLIGLLAVQLLRAQGCRVLGIDFDERKLDLARQFGAEIVNLGREEDPLDAADRLSGGRGVDAVLLAAATKSSEPVSQAARMCRKRGRIVLIGVTGLELNRADFYEKEVSFQVSCSYGPGRYDDEYEQKGHDYPIGFVRWTEQRNFEAVLRTMKEGRLQIEPLISSRFSIADAEDAYRVLHEDQTSLGILLEYPDCGTGERPDRTVTLPKVSAAPEAAPGVSFLGTGNYAGRILIPAFRKAGARLVTAASAGGVSSVHYGRKLGFRRASTDTREAITDPDCSTVVIATRHDSHAELVCEALYAGKHVFVEKPLALTLGEIDEVERVYREVNEASSGKAGQLLMVGFNRRFAPQVVRIHQLLGAVHKPKSFVMTVNAGDIPSDHWTQDPDVGGGRIIGEGCHFIDLLRYLADAPITGFDTTCMGGAPGPEVRSDKASITLSFSDGSFGTVHYLSNGHKSFPKERLEVFCAGRVLQLDNFRRLRGFGWPGFRSMNLWRQDKGQKACAARFCEAVRSGTPAPIPMDEILEVSRSTVEIAQAL